MSNEFLITSESLKRYQTANCLDLISSSRSFQVYARGVNLSIFDSVKVILDGYVIPRIDIYEEYKNFGQYDLVNALYRRFQDDFIRHLKGTFIIVIIGNKNVKLFNDCLGICKFFYTVSSEHSSVSNSFGLLKDYSRSNAINHDFFWMKPLLNREMNGETAFANIARSQPATKLTYGREGVKVEQYWKHDHLLEKQGAKRTFGHFSGILRDNIKSYNQFLKPAKNTITLTGGKDSRTALAALLSVGIKPIGITYGDPFSKDAVFASLLAKRARIQHKIFNQPRTAECFEAIAKEIIELDNPTINIHRGHRYYAFRNMNEMLGSNTAYYAGYMGGELLMGVYYDDLIFTNFVTHSWDHASRFRDMCDVYKRSFIRPEKVELDGIYEKLKRLKTFDPTLSKRLREFHGLFEIGVLHHSQDLQLAMQFSDFVIPFFLDIDFLEAIFSSRFSFFYRNNKTKNLLTRYHLYEFNLNLQHILCPELDVVPFAKRGGYNTVEFLKGPLYWSFIKASRYFGDRKKYPVTFSYDEAYRQFLYKWLGVIGLDNHTPIHDIYDITRARNSLEVIRMPASERDIMPFSNIVMHYLQIRRYTGDGI